MNKILYKLTQNNKKEYISHFFKYHPYEKQAKRLKNSSLSINTWKIPNFKNERDKKNNGI